MAEGLTRQQKRQAARKAAKLVRPDPARAPARTGAPPDPDAALAAAVNCHGTGALDEAERLYRQVLSVWPDHPDAWHFLGFLVYQKGDARSATVLIEKALGLNPDCAEAHNNLGLALLDCGRAEEAEAAFQQAIALDPEIAEPHSNLGTVLQESGRTEEAVACYRRALAIKEDYAGALCNLASAYQELGEPEEAAAYCRKAIALNDALPQAHNNLGLALQELGRGEEAEGSIRKAIFLDPNYAEAYCNLSHVLGLLGRPGEAEASARKAIAIKPNYAKAYARLGRALLIQGKLEDAAAAYRRALEIGPASAQLHTNLGNVLKQQGKEDEAIACYREAVAIEPSYGPATHMLAALSGEAIDSAPKDFVERLFDEYAETFERHIVGQLEYMTPRLLRERIDALVGGGGRFDSVLDLGCGTGLAGGEFRAISKRLDGVDLSRKMIEEARKKGIYDGLEAGDIIAYLEKTRKKYDLFIAADVLVYVGNLSPVFSLARDKARKRAFFAFSTEVCEGDGYVLNRTGRYAHSRAYLEHVASERGFDVASLETTVIRKENGAPVPGHVVVLRLRSR